jgi:hypothetical protein
MLPPCCSINRASCAITGEPHQPVSPTMLIHVAPDEGGVGDGVDCGDSLTGVSIAIGGSGVITTGGVIGVGDEGVPPPHQLAANAHQRTTTACRIREGRADINCRFLHSEPGCAQLVYYFVSIMKKAATFGLAVVAAFLAVSTPVLAQTADDLFARQDLQRIDLFVHSSDWAKLRAEFQTNTYYPADFTWNGQTVRNVGIRSRGRGSRSGNKPGLRVDFDRYTTGGRFLGLKSLVLDNLTQDQSGIHETVAMAFYARLGIPASRELHARLYVNNEYAGLYAVVESVDKELLARVFGAIGDDTQNDGWLYEFKWQDNWFFTYFGGDLREYMLRFEATTHESKSDEEKYRPIENLIRLANTTPTDRFAAEVGAKLDLAQVTRFIAAQVFLAETDGFLGGFGINNLYLYRLENSDVHVFIAWDADNTFYHPEYPTNSGMNDNILMRALIAMPEYQGLFWEEMRRNVQMAEEGDWLHNEITRNLQRIDTAMKEDPVKPYGNGAYEAKAGEMLNFARTRIAFVKCELERGPGNPSCRTQ